MTARGGPRQGRETSPITKPETSVGHVGGDARVLLRLDAASMQKPLEYGPVGDDAEVRVVFA
jgi:hypothetical protein